MSGLGDFNFKIKIVQTDLTCGNYLYNSIGEIFGGFRNDSPAVYQNSSYISKLYFINNFSGGILKKDRIEDMPERYRCFIQSDNPGEANIIKNLKKELYALANREEVGQNVFYNRLSSPEVLTKPGGSSYDAEPPNESESFEEKNQFIRDFDKPDVFETLSSVLFEELAGEDYDGNAEYEDEYDEYEEYEDNEEIKDILHLNSYYNSEMYKMSKIEYDFSASGSITVTDSGSMEIKYDEGETTGLDGSYIQIFFNPEEKDIVTVRRKNFFDSWFTLEKGKRISSGETEPGRYSETGAVLTTHTKELVNNITPDGGDMRIVYITETNGVPSEMISHSIQAVRNTGEHN